MRVDDRFGPHLYTLMNMLSEEYHFIFSLSAASPGRDSAFLLAANRVHFLTSGTNEEEDVYSSLVRLLSAHAAVPVDRIILSEARPARHHPEKIYATLSRRGTQHYEKALCRIARELGEEGLESFLETKHVHWDFDDKPKEWWYPY